MERRAAIPATPFFLVISVKNSPVNVALEQFGSNVQSVVAKAVEGILTACTVRSAKMIIVDCQQGSEEWHEARLGFVTASNFINVLNKMTGRGLYMRKLAAERLTGLREDGYYDKNMKNGNLTEDEALNYYAMANDCIVNEVGFVKRDDDIGGSPDGLIGEEGIIETKCPLSSTHIANIINNKMPSEYKPQVQGLLWITERQWCDFISYDPRNPYRPMFPVRVERDAEYIKNLAGQVGLFIKELKKMVNKIQGDF